MKQVLAVIFSLTVAIAAAAQQPATQNAPIFATNAQWVQGIGIGYWPTPGSGLTLNVAAGTANCAGTRVAYAGGTLTMTASATNYVYLDGTSSCVLAQNTTGYPSTNAIFIATVVTSGSAITGITDDRTMFFIGNGASSGANTALSNLSSVAINTNLLCASAGSCNLGSSSIPFGTGYFGSGVQTGLGSGVAGYWAPAQGTAPTLSSFTHSVVHYAPTSVPTKFGMVDPTADFTGALWYTDSGHIMTPGAMTAANVVGLWASGSCSGLLKSDGTCISTVHALSFQAGTPGGSALSTGVLGYFTVPIGCAITGWDIEVDAGTATVKTLKVASGTSIPTLGSNSISTSGVSISTGTVIQSTTLTDFTTTTVTANDIVGADMITTSGVGYINFQLVLGCSQ
jgi:hypothetical protein